MAIDQLFDVKSVLPVLLTLLLVSCGRRPDPPFVTRTGDLGAFLLEAISGRNPELANSNRLTTSWSSRVLTQDHQSGEYLDGRQALQVATAKTNFVFVESLLTQQLGSPSPPLRQEGGWRHIGWSLPNQKLGVWLIEEPNQCRIEIVTEQSRNLL